MSRKVIALLLILVLPLDLVWAVQIAPTQDEIEIKYDDGVMERWWTKTTTGVGDMFGVFFESPFARFVLSNVRIFFAEDGPFRLLVFDCGAEPSGGGCTQLLTKSLDASGSPRWFVIDLSADGLVLERPFLVAVQWAAGSRPKIGVDEDAPQSRSWSFDVDLGKWERFSDLAARFNARNGNVLVRATVRPAEYSVMIDADPRTIPLVVDGGSVGAQELPKNYKWAPGSEHAISAPEIVEGKPGTRFVFVQWSDGNRDLSRTIAVPAAVEFRAVYKTQYELRVLSEHGDTYGSGWHDAGSKSSFSVSPSYIGFLIVQVFDGWMGNSSGNLPNDVVVMDSAKTVVARWRTDYTQLLIFLGFTIGLTLVGGVAERFRKRRAVQART